MLKPIALATFGCLVAVTFLSTASAGGNDDSLTIDLTTVTGEKYYIIGKSIYRESNGFPDLQKHAFYSEGKKRVVENDELILS